MIKTMHLKYFFQHSFPYGLLIGLFCTYACTVTEIGPPGEDGVSDLQIRLPLGVETSTAMDTVFTDAQFDLIKFNRDNYALVDSIVFASRLRSTDTTASCIVELFNVTDNTIVSGSEISSNSSEFVWIESNNILNSLPASREITLRVRLRSENPGVTVQGGQSFLFLYRPSTN